MSKLNENEVKQSVIDYFLKQQKVKSINAKFDIIKKQFYSVMENYFNSNKCDEYKFETDTNDITVKRIQKVSIRFNADKLEKVLPKKYSEQVILKKYEINDMAGLIVYLKECGVDPKVFKSFITVSKSVDEKQIEQLEAVGKISQDQIKGCYSVKTNDPYFKVSGGKVQGGKD